MKPTDEEVLALAQKMLKQAGSCSPELLAYAAKMCIDLACMCKNPVKWFDYLDMLQAAKESRDAI